MKQHKKIALSIATSLLLANSLFAQDSTTLDTVTVTAQKSEENIQDVPINITVFNEFDIEDKKIDKIEDIAAYTPNLMMFSYGGDKQLTPSLRGIFSDVESRTIPVGIYIDDVPVLDGWSMNELLDDIQSIEVLKGPQGTLYGKNTETGVINIYTKQPSNEFKSSIGIELGNDNRRKLSLKASGPIIKDKFFAGISFVHNEKDGFIKDATTGKTLDDRERNFVKLTLKAIINDNLEATLINSYLKNNNGGQRISYVSQTQDSLSSDIDNYDKSKTTNSSLKIKFNTSDNSSIESITTRRYVQDDTSTDWDFTNDATNPWKFHLSNDETIESLSQEIRYKQTLFDNKLNVLFGLFLDKKEDKFYYTQDTAGGITNIKIDLNDKSLGLFSHFAYNINEKTTFITGLRYDKETKKYKHENQGIDTSNVYSELSPKISLEYKLDENKMIYSTISKGYRAGGFNYLAPKGHEDISFDKESLWSYELGSKLALYENKIHINSSIYYMDIANMQVTNATSPTEEYVTNVAKAHSIGFEIETNIKVTDNLTSSFSFGYNETKFDEFIDT